MIREEARLSVALDELRQSFDETFTRSPAPDTR